MITYCFFFNSGDTYLKTLPVCLDFWAIPCSTAEWIIWFYTISSRNRNAYLFEPQVDRIVCVFSCKQYWSHCVRAFVVPSVNTD